MLVLANLFCSVQKRMEVVMKKNKIFVGNLIYYATEEMIRELFGQFGHIVSVAVFPKNGFALVEMSSEDEMEHAIAELNESVFEGKTIYVQLANPEMRSERRSSARKMAIHGSFYLSMR